MCKYIFLPFMRLIVHNIYKCLGCIQMNYMIKWREKVGRKVAVQELAQAEVEDVAQAVGSVQQHQGASVLFLQVRIPPHHFTRFLNVFFEAWIYITPDVNFALSKDSRVWNIALIIEILYICRHNFGLYPKLFGTVIFIHLSVLLILSYASST
jgi:hypothetical protein